MRLKKTVLTQPLDYDNLNSTGVNGLTPYYVLLNPAMKENYLGKSAKERVYGCGIDHEEAIWVLHYFYGNLQQIFWVLKILICVNQIIWQTQWHNFATSVPKTKMMLNTGRLFQADIMEGGRLSTSSLII